MKRTIVTTFALLAGLIPTTAQAAVLNGGFEDGFNRWETLGDTSIETSEFGSGPIKGSQAFLSTAFNEVIGVKDGDELRGGNAAPVFSVLPGSKSLESFLGASTFLDSSFTELTTADDPLDVIEGSALKQTVAARAGDVLSFSYNFLTDELVEDNAQPQFNDYAFVSLQSDQANAKASSFQLADALNGSFNDSSTNFFEETGFQTFSYTFPANGNYTLGVGVVDVGEPTRISGLLVDQATVKPVPEPSSTLGLLTIGASITAFKLRRSRRRAKQAR